ncbi:hypothetical protein BV898_10744 [Hypsibius exemplaris]|uniref:Tetraspanin n=1 Tax=Hypsibius exemplaris TaxID=2072580 RepID=A0A1W0WIR5_HYPEX|nr:hypothetical protein BV898_10744 [Hypsibius exemplaris]
MKLAIISKFILFTLTIIYGMFGIILFGLATWILAGDQGTYVQHLRLVEIRAGAALLLTTGIFLICISLIGCFAVARKDVKLMTAYFGCIIITTVLCFAGSVFLLASNKVIEAHINEHIDRMVRDYNNRGPQQREAETFMDLIQTHLFCCGAESANDYYIRGIPPSCLRPWQSGVSQVWGCKEVMKRWLKYNLDAIAGIGLFMCVLLVVGAVAAWMLRRSYYSSDPVTTVRQGRKL